MEANDNGIIDMNAIVDLGEIAASDIVSKTRWSRNSQEEDERGIVTLLLLYGSWNKWRRRPLLQFSDEIAATKGWLWQAAKVQVDRDERSLDVCISDRPSQDFPLKAPPDLPAVAMIVVGGPQSKCIQYVNISSRRLLSCIRHNQNVALLLRDPVQQALQHAMTTTIQTIGYTKADGNKPEEEEDAPLRIFVAGDRSQVGKSSVCLGLLGTLLRPPFLYPPSTLAYIKPATQCEATQLVTDFCTRHGIANCPVGPIVYYKGFTRAFLDGEITENLLLLAGEAVDRISRHKKIVIVDGVGYPAVGSVCGTDNASMALACGYPFQKEERLALPVLIVGKSGVGDAIDSYNLNATYFKARDVPVMGAIFNRLSPDGYYSLENCKKAITSYFTQYKATMTTTDSERMMNHVPEVPFGFIPEIFGNANTKMSRTIDEQERTGGKERTNSINNAEEFITIFSEHVNVEAIIRIAKRIRQCQERSSDTSSLPNNDDDDDEHVTNTTLNDHGPFRKKTKTFSIHAEKQQSGVATRLTRNQIEEAAARQGAAGGA